MIIKRKICICISALLLCLLFLHIQLPLILFPDTQNSVLSNNPANEIIILFQSNIDILKQKEILKNYSKEIIILEQLGNYTLCKTSNVKKMSNIIIDLNKNPNILIAEQNAEVLLESTTHDPFTDSQWPLKNNGFYYQITATKKVMKSSTPNIDLNILKAWSLDATNEKTNKEVIVAVLDTGVDINHPDLNGRIWTNLSEVPGDGIDNDNNGYIDDTVGWDFYNNDNTVCHYQFDSLKNTNIASVLDNDNHGTHIAGIIAANANNKLGIAGVASNINIKIMPLKIHGGTNGKGTIANAIKAIHYATLMGADICNMSWGFTNYSEALETAMKESTMLFVTAAGNAGSDNDISPLYPANYGLDNQISVSFIDADGKLTPDSNYGVNTVDIVAPGINIISTIVGSYATMSGSSMSAPHISAIAAMLYSYSDYCYASNVKQIIVQNIKPLPNLESFIKYPGVPNAAAIIASVNELKEDYIQPTLDLSTSYDKNRIVVRINPKDSDSSIRVIRYAIGERSSDYFMRGTNGLSIQDNVLTIAKSGTYTFYVSDYVGNDIAQIYEVVDDLTAPDIKTSYKVSDNYATITISTKISDSQSGVKVVKFAEGAKTMDYFLATDSSKSIQLENDSFIFDTDKPSKYTIYAQDYRGNKSLAYVTARIVKSINIKLNRTDKTLGVGKYFRLWSTLSPKNSTDQVTYTSSNPQIVTVNKWGLLKGISPGQATITAKTSSGIEKKCVVTVKKSSQ